MVSNEKPLEEKFFSNQPILETSMKGSNWTTALQLLAHSLPGIDYYWWDVIPIRTN